MSSLPRVFQAVQVLSVISVWYMKHGHDLQREMQENAGKETLRSKSRSILCMYYDVRWIKLCRRTT